MGPRTSLDNVGLDLRSLGRRSGNQSVYRLRYLGSYISGIVIHKISVSIAASLGNHIQMQTVKEMLELLLNINSIALSFRQLDY
jgi:hypothetical protein